MTFVINSAKTTDPADAWHHSFSSTQLLTGEWNSEDGTGTVRDGGVEVKMERFFELNGHQYGICVYSYTSQINRKLEEDYILLVRP